jgi:glycosyltransferase involved in cell wall biosynthesis
VRPRVLFVSRERFKLPLDGVQKRKWGALMAVVEPRVVAAAPARWPTQDEHFHLVGPTRPHMLDGALYYLLLPWRVVRELRAFRPEAVLVQGVHEGVAVLLACRFAGERPKVILDVQGDWRAATRLYGSSFRRLLNPVNDSLAPVAVRRADAVRTISAHTTAIVRDLGVEPVATFPPYVDAAVFARSEPAPLPDRPVALFVGVLEAYKNIEGLAEAWPLVAARLPEASLHLVGSGTRTDLAEKLVRDHGARWDPELAADEVAGALDAAWLLVLPSRAEGLGRVLVEAACRGRALVGADRGGIPDVVRHEENGLLVDPDAPEEIADALVRILGDRTLAMRFGAAARKTGEEWTVTPEQYAAKVEAVVQRALHAT